MYIKTTEQRLLTLLYVGSIAEMCYVDLLTMTRYCVSIFVVAQLMVLKGGTAIKVFVPIVIHSTDSPMI